jgi:acid phosphatase type 7
MPKDRAIALVVVWLTAAAAVVVLAGPPVPVAAEPSTTLTPVADAYVSAGSPTRNHGASTSLRVDTEPDVMRTYLRFDLGSSGAAVTRATLRLYAASSSSVGYTVHPVTDLAWSESGITYAGAPAPGAAIGASGRFGASTWTSVDVTSAVAGARTVSFALSGIGTTAMRLLSRESGSTGPQLVIELGTSPTSTTTTSSTLPPSTVPTTAPPADVQPAFPMRGAFYYPWFPESWRQSGVYPFANHRPSAGFYDGGDIAVVRQHVEAMQYGKIQMGIASWWGRGHSTDARLATLLRAADGSTFRWSVYHEGEGSGDPSVGALTDDLAHLAQTLARDPSALRIDGRFVVFVYADAGDGCAMADRWKAANTVGAYVVLKVFRGYATCASQPDGWHQYGPATAADAQGVHSYSISPGFWKHGDPVRLSRDLERWRRNVREMTTSGARFQLVTTFNEWGEGTAVESAEEWATDTGYGAFLDVLHLDGEPPPTTPTTTVPAITTPSTTTTSPVPTTSVPAGADPRIVAAGDIACDPANRNFNGGLGTDRACQQQSTSDLVVGAGYAAVLGLGDLQYERGTYDAFLASYDPSWGRVRDITRPVPGNHEYLTDDAAGYFEYFGAAAGDPAKGYYSFDIGQWHLVALNSNCGEVSCSEGSVQEAWLRADLAANETACSLVYWHHPRFSSGNHGSDPDMTALFQAAYDHGVEVVLSGHDHIYERFAPQSPDGHLDLARGVRQFVVGSGGRNYYPAGAPRPNSEVLDDETFGVLELTLHATSYSWQFMPTAGSTFVDAGTQSCH